MIDIIYPPSFIRRFGKLPTGLQEEILERIESFKDRKNHESLKVHVLHGKWKGYSSFSVNYKMRIIFRFISKKEVLFVDIDDHDVYK